jgi:hypothetical protein
MQRAGTVEQEFFRPHDVFVSTFFPASIMTLIGQWLQAPPTTGAIPNDTRERPFIRGPWDFKHGI